MHRPHNHYGIHFEPTYTRRGYRNEDKMIELIQEFRAFKPYLKKRLDFINQTKRQLELQDEVEDINLYLDVMQQILGDDKYDADQIRGFIDKVHEMIRKNPMTELPNANRELDDLEEFGDDDRPRSPSPGPMASNNNPGGAASHIPLESSYDTHRVVDVNWDASTIDDPIELDEWGKPIHDTSFTRREPYQDVDMRRPYYAGSNSGVIGRGQPRRWSGECDRGGGFGRGAVIGRGAPIPHRRDDYDGRMGRPPYGENDRDSYYRNSHYLDRSREPPPEPPQIKPPPWLLDSPNESNSNEWTSHLDNRQRRSDSWDSNNWENAGFDRRPQHQQQQPPHQHRDEWRRSQSEAQSRNNEKFRLAEELNKYRRPSSETRDRPHGSSPRREMPVRPPYPPPQSGRPMPPMPHGHVRPGYGGYPPNTGPGLLPTPPMPYQSPHLPQSPAGGQSPIRPPIQSPGHPRPMGFQQSQSQSQVNSYGHGRHELSRPPGGGYNIPPPKMLPPRTTMQPPQPQPPPHLSSPDPYQSHHGQESEADNVRQISSRLAKQCFNRRPATTATSSHARAISPGPASPVGDSHSPSQSPLDPRLSRQQGTGISRPVTSTIHRVARQPPSPPSTSSYRRPSASDAGNVLITKPTGSSDPRGHSHSYGHRTDHERRRLEEARERVRQAEAARPISKQPTKLQELRKQIEKEGFFRLGRPNNSSKKSFEDALASCDNEPEGEAETGPVAGTSKEKSKSPTRKDKDNESRSGSQTNKTDAEKKSGGEKHKNKDKTTSSGKSGKDDKNQKQKKQIQGSKIDKSKSNKGTGKSVHSKSGKSSTEMPSTSKDSNTFSLKSFKIPRKPKPKPPERTESINDKDISNTPPSPSSPEPALSQMTDHDNEPTPTSSKATSKNTSSSHDEPSPDALNVLKNIIMGVREPNNKKDLSQDELKDLYKKITAMYADGDKSNKESNSNQTETEGPDNDASQDDDVQERGRSREKKRNTKRRSSLEKLHDALKEMRFDTMLPLGPRRCTRGGGQDETAESESGTSDVNASEGSVELAQSSTSSGVGSTSRKSDASSKESQSSKPATRKRGRPPKEAAAAKKGKAKVKVSAKKGAKAKEIAITEAESVPSNEETNAETELPPAAPSARRGRKRKLKTTKVNAKKRVKKSGPVTRAQAALKKSHKDLAKQKTNTAEQSQGFDNRARDGAVRKKKTTNMILRRLSKKRIGAKDTLVNTGLNKIKVDTDAAERIKMELAMKAEAQEQDNFFGGQDDIFVDTGDADGGNTGSQLADLIEDLDHDTVASMDRQFEENMDLGVFDALDSEDQVSDVFVKDELDIPLEMEGVEEEENESDLSYEVILNKSSSTAPASATTRKTRRSGVSPISSPACNETVTTPTGTGITEPKNDTLRNSHENNANQVDSLVDPNGGSSSTSTPSDPVPVAATEETKSKENLEIASTISESSCNSNEQETLSTVNPPTPTTETSSTMPSTSNSLKAEITTDDSNDDDGKVTLSDLKSEPADLDDLRKDVYKCEQCPFSGKKIVSHYVNKHYPCNIPQARLMSETFEGLIELNSSESPQLLEIVLDEDINSPVWPCLYCDDRYDCIVEFYDHLTSHTGEFRYECSECGIAYPHQKSLANHVKQHKGMSKNCMRMVFDSHITKESRDLSGFLCNDCYYFQLRFESIMRHIDETQHSALDVKSVKLIFTPADKGNSSNASVTALPDAEGSASATVSPSPSPTKKVQPSESQRKTSTPAKTSDSQIHSATTITEENKEDIRESVFFSTDVNFSPPSVSLVECTTLPVEPVFEDKFVENLLKRVCEPDNNEDLNVTETSNTTTNSETLPPESRKRKRSGSDDNDEISQEKAEERNVTVDDDDGEPPRRRPNLRTTCTSRSSNKFIKLKWKDETDPFREEPNDFLVSSDESSEETSDSSSEDDVDVEDKNLEVRKETVKTEPTDHHLDTDSMEYRNNDHLIKTRGDIQEDSCDLKVKKLRNFVDIHRVGDEYAPNTVLYGFLKTPAHAKPAHKLRDNREADRVNMIYGRRIRATKCPEKLAEMLTPQKLMHFFKCMGRDCSYTCDLPSEFVEHLFEYHHILSNTCARFFTIEDIREYRDSDCCSYCSARYIDPKDLVDHIVNQHGLCVFQCTKCFYRSYYHRNVARHVEMEHPDEPKPHVLKCQRKVDVTAQEATLFQIFVYKCEVDNPNCDKTRRFVFREDFIEHLTNCVPLRDLYPCHLCRTSVPLTEIVEHYKIHNLFKFHCSYCQFGSEVKTDLDEHFVLLHPNTSGRVFYRIKPTPSNPNETGGQAYITHVPKFYDKPPKHSAPNLEMTDGTSQHSLPESMDQQPPNELAGNEGSGMDVSENEDGEKGRVTNLRGHDLYRCTTGGCGFTAVDSDKFKDHVSTCSFVTESRSLSCAHCERKLKSVTNLLEHLKVHGEKKQVCSLCSFRCYTSTEITKHVKTVHKMMNYKLIRNEPTSKEPDPDVIAFPKDVATKSACNVETFENNYYQFSRKAVYSFENINKLPLSKVFSSDLFCAICPYSTKVRSNIVRHLSIHKQALEDGKTVVPQAPRINPVPYLSREGLEFDKMMNLAASSHKSNSATATADDVRKLPEFVKEQFRYVCSVCDHITSDENLLQTHIKVIHSEVTMYRCPHCQRNAGTRDNPEYIVSLDKIAHHLKLHGPKLYKCGHCTALHHQLRLMEKHIPEKHPEKKPIHYLIRDVDPDGVPSSRPTTSGMSRRQSNDDPKITSTEKWKCFLCSSKSFFGSWLEAKNHCELIHKVTSQFRCLICEFTSDEVTEMLTHCRETCTCKSTKKNQILVMFSKCENFDVEDTSVTLPVWKRHGGAVRHIHGNFTEDSVALIKQYNSQQLSDVGSSSSTSSPLRGAPGLPATASKSQVKPSSSTGGKARRSVSFPNTPPKPSTPPIPVSITPPPPPKQEVFKYRCHKCDMYKTKNANELRVHLFNEFRYKRWKCLICLTTFTTEKSLKGHIERDHQKLYQSEFFELQPENFEIEAEINECIEKQNRKRDMINSFAMEKNGKLTCKNCKEDGLTYDTFETHILLKHSS